MLYFCFVSQIILFIIIIISNKHWGVRISVWLGKV